MNYFTQKLSSEQVSKLHSILIHQGFEFISKPHTTYSAQKPGLHVSVYEKGFKILVQGKGTRDFVSFVLEPEILGEVKLGYENIVMSEQFTPHFGIDESGKGDFFGPLVIAGVYTDHRLAKYLKDSGIMDSKSVSSSARIRKLAELIKASPGVFYDVVAIRPEKYNEIYPTFKNLNHMLAWGHSLIAEELLRKKPDCPRSLSDQFARTDLLVSAFKKKKLDIIIDQRTKAESDIAVAAASILARERFIDWMDAASKHLGFTLPLGCSSKVVDAGKKMVLLRGDEILKKFAKLHFKTSQQVLND